MAIPLLRDGIEYCEKVRDYGSRDLLNKILHNEEEHVDYLETQFDLIDRMGIQNYIQLQSKPNASLHSMSSTRTRTATRSTTSAPTRSGPMRRACR
jgi:hypothetical protein